MHEKGRHLSHANLDGIAGQHIHARDEDMIEGSVQIIRTGWNAKQTGEPKAQITGGPWAP